MRDPFELIRLVGRTLDLLSGISLTNILIVSDFLFIWLVSILPESRKEVLLPVGIARTPVGTIDSLRRK